MYVVQFLARNELYVLLDNQFNFDTTAITDTSGWVEVRSPILPPLCTLPPVAMETHGAVYAPDQSLISYII